MLALLAAGADPNARVGGRALVHRAEWTALELGVLLRCGADPNARNDWGETPAHVWVARNDGRRQEVAAAPDALRRAGADLEARDTLGRSVLDVAVRRGFVEAVEVLLGMGVRPRPVMIQDELAWSHGVPRSRAERIRALLHQSGG